MRIGIIGGGVVGHATARCYVESHEVRVYDLDPKRATHSLGEVYASDLIFVCVPEQYLDGVLNIKTGSANREAEVRQRNFVIRSTCPIGTTRTMSERHLLPNLCHSPEFLTERCAITDAQLPARNIIGSLCYGRGASIGSEQCGSLLHGLYSERFPGVPIHCMSTDESEAVKLFTNSFFAVKVAFFNEVNLLSQRLGLDWETVLKGMLSDGRISHSHTKVPGPDGKFGFGGKCLPKDLKTVVDALHGYVDGDRLYTAAFLSEAALVRNDADRKRKS